MLNNRGSLILIFLVFVAVIGLGAMYIIPPIDKEARFVLEDVYEGRLIDLYRSFHDYLYIEDVDRNPLKGALDNMSDNKFIDADTNAILKDMIDKGYISKEMKENTIFPDTEGNMTWEIILIPLK